MRGTPRILEVRRHSMRRKPGAHLSAEGISLARFIGSAMGRFDRIFTSRLPRAYETAVAMGYEIDGEIEELGILPESLSHATGWPADISTIATNAQCNRRLAEFAETQANMWRSTLESLKAGDHRALMISHGAIMELGVLAAAGWASAERFGGVFGYCEGVRLNYQGSRCVSIEVMRVPEDRRLVES